MPSQLQLMGIFLKLKSFVKSIGESPFETNERGELDIKGKETDGWVDQFKLSWINIICLAGMAFAGVTLGLTSGVVVTMASYFVMAFGPLTMVQKCKLNALGGLRGQINMLRASVNELSRENDKLHASVDQLEGQVQDLSKVEEGLQEVASTAGTQVDQLIRIVEENGELQQKIKTNLEASVMQAILTAVLTSDRDEDFHLDARELKRLKLRLTNLPAIEFDEKNFDKFIGRQQSLTLEKLMQILRNLKDESIPEKDHVFHLHPEQLPKAQ